MSEESSKWGKARGVQLQADLILLGVAIIWGSAFVAQRVGNYWMGPFTFNGARFAVGCAAVLALVGRKRAAWRSVEWRGGLLLGLLLFGGASLQQLGLVYTSAGKAGFITGLYVVITPLLLATVWRRRVTWSAWAGAGLAAIGLFLLSVRADFRLSPGDGWVLAGAFVWALHVIAVGHFAPGHDPLQLAVVQYAVCALLCMGVALVTERQTWGGILPGSAAILYAGIFSTALAYTGQIVAQRRANPTHAAIILSLEAVFAAFFGWLLLQEMLTERQVVGCVLMLGGMLLAQVEVFSEG